MSGIFTAAGSCFSNGTTLTFGGSEIFAPHGTASPGVTMGDNGPVLDAGSSTSGDYATFGPSTANLVIDCTFQQTASYKGANPDTDCHAGMMLRYSDDNNFAGMALISVLAGDFAIIDRVGGTEYKQTVATGLSLAYNTTYRLRIENTSGNSARARLWTAGGTLLGDLSWTYQTGVPAAGRPGMHVYAAAMCVLSLDLLDSSLSGIVTGSQVWGSVKTGSTRTRVKATSGLMDLYCDGTNISVNDWGIVLSSVKRQDCTIVGTMKRVSVARLMGITFRNSPNGNGYLFYHDTENGIRLARSLETGFTVIHTWAATLTTGTTYPFTLTVAGNSFSLTIDGTTYTDTDNTISAAGYVGVAGYSVNAQFGQMTIG